MLGQCRGGSIGGYEMRQEMRKLNRAKYAHTVEEMVQLSAQGYVPVGTAAADPPDAVSGQPAADSVREDKKAARPKAVSGKMDKKTKQPAAAPKQKGSSTEQPAERPDQTEAAPKQSAGTPEQPAADPAQAVTDGGDSGT